MFVSGSLESQEVQGRRRVGTEGNRVATTVPSGPFESPRRGPGPQGGVTRWDSVLPTKSRRVPGSHWTLTGVGGDLDVCPGTVWVPKSVRTKVYTDPVQIWDFET